MTPWISTREGWLIEMTNRLRPMFDACGKPIPQTVRASCSWPSHRALRTSGSTASRVIGECWRTDASADGSNELLVSLSLADELAVSECLVHELVHAALNCEHGHKGPFRTLALQLGLAGKMTCTFAGPQLAEILRSFAAELGPYPHAVLDRTNEKKQSTRLIKVACPNEGCDYIVRMSQKCIDIGLPTCPCGEEMVQEVSQ